MLDVRRLCLLRDLAHLGTVAAVAEAHAYTPSAVSQQLAALQRQAGVPLLERAGRRLYLTPAGEALVRHTETVLAALEAATAELAAARTGLSGQVRIGAFPSAVRTLLPAALVSLGRDHPALDLAITELDPVAMPAALREHRLDVALTHDYDLVPAEPDPTMESVPLLEEPVFLARCALDAEPGAPTGATKPDGETGAETGTETRSGAGSGAGTAESGPAESGTAESGTAARPAEPDAWGGLAEPDDDPIRAARHADWIVGSPGTLCHAVTARACREAGFSPTLRHHVDDFTAALALVAAGRGVALVPRLGALEPHPGVRLIPLPIRRRTRVAFRRGAGAHPAVAASVAAIRVAAACLAGATGSA